MTEIVRLGSADASPTKGAAQASCLPGLIARRLVNFLAGLTHTLQVFWQFSSETQPPTSESIFRARK